ncbi:MAG: dihydropteroate synthase [Flavobacteriales bacterium]|nr:dihydropteroate synthase [Flavobacteriales bacterium]
MSQRKYIRLKGRLLDLSQPRVVGIVNVTPDSFYAPSRASSASEVISRVEQMLEQGVDIVDVGAVSTRPGALMPDAEEEWRRLKPALEALVKEWPELPVSVDTWRPEIARRALDAGAAMINDISGGTFEEGMARTAAEYQVPVVLMHTSAPPHLMQNHTDYEDVVRDVMAFLISQATAWEQEGVRDIIIDPGIGFGKTIFQNFELLAYLHLYKTLPWPVMVGLSRKRFIRVTLGVNAEEALNGTTALHMVCLQAGVRLLRVHDVKEAVQCIKLFMSLQEASAIP